MKKLICLICLLSASVLGQESANRKKPLIENYKTIGDYVEALADWKATQRAISSSATVQRYQLIQAKAQLPNQAGTTTAFDDLFMLDTQTGQVWRWQASDSMRTTGGTLKAQQHFESVFVDKLDGDASTLVTFHPDPDKQAAASK
jgi:hypothetical protein